MKSTGIVRTVDRVGRFVIPMELRRLLNITDAEDSLEIFVENDKIILRKYSRDPNAIVSTGIVRTVDRVGRFVIPMELRKHLNIADAEDSLEIFVDDEKIILKKYSPSCIFCKSLDDIIEYNGHKICKDCVKKLYARAIEND